MTTPFVVRSDKECRWSDYIVVVFAGHAGVFSKTPKLKYAQSPALVNSAGLLRYGDHRDLHSFPTRRSRWSPYRSEEHTSELQSHSHLVCRLLLEKTERH